MPIKLSELREYYEQEARSGDRQQAMYESGNAWDRFFHRRLWHAITSVLAELEGDRFLEVGCAEGRYLREYNRYHPQAALVGLDLATNYLYKVRCQMPSVGTIAGDACSLPFADECFDVVLCSETLEHVLDPAMAVRELARCTRHYLVISVPGKTSFYYWAKAIGLVSKKDEMTLMHNCSGHLHLITLEDICIWLADAPFTVAKKVVGCHVPRFASSALRLPENAIAALDRLLSHFPCTQRHGVLQVIVLQRGGSHVKDQSENGVPLRRK